MQNSGKGRAAEPKAEASPGYALEQQVGFLLRRAQQRHLSLFNAKMPGDLTAQQFAVLARIREKGSLSQNELGRQTAMDQSTINGVVHRLTKRGLVEKRRSEQDKRMLLLDLTEAGASKIDEALPLAHHVTRETLAPLSSADCTILLQLLRGIC